MAINAGDVIWTIKGDTTNLDSSLKSSLDGVNRLGTVFGVAGAAITGVLGGVVAGFMSYGDEIGKAAKRTGVTTEAISVFKHAAEQSGTTLSAVETGLKRMARTLDEAGQGVVSYTEVFDRLGLSYADMAGMEPDEQFLTIAEALSHVDDATTKAALAQEIFGRSGTELIPLIDQGRAGFKAYREEAERLGIVLDQETAAQAEAFTDVMDELKKTMQGLIVEIGPHLIPMLQDLVENLKDGIIAVTAWAREHPVLTGVLVKFAAVLGPLLITLGAVMKIVATFGLAVNALSPAFAAASAKMGLFTVGLGGAVAAGGVITIGIAALALLTVEIVKTAQAWSAASEQEEQADAGMQRLISSLQAQGVELNNVRLATMGHNQQMMAIRDAVSVAEEAQQREISALNGVRTAMRETTHTTAAGLSQMIAAYGTARTAISQDMDSTRQKIRLLDPGEHQSPSVVETTTRSLSAIVNTYGAAANQISSIVGSLRAVVVGAFQSMINFAAAAANTIAGFRLPGFASGGVVGRFASGGVSQHALAMVGERGPEVAAFPVGTRIMSNADMRQAVGGVSGGGNVTVGDIHVSVNGGGVNDVRELARQIRSEIDHELGRALRQRLSARGQGLALSGA